MSKGLYVSCFLFLFGWLTSSNGAAPESAPTGAGWLIQVADEVDAVEAAEAAGAVYAGPLENVDGWHRVAFIQPLSKGRAEHRDTVLRTLAARSDLLQFEEVTEVRMYPRRFVPQDPLFTQQWHHENLGRGEAFAGSDIRVRPAWDRGLSGRGVIIGIVDQGTDFRHPDLSPNYLTGSGRDYVDHDDDASPNAALREPHGTAVSGICVAASNSIGGIGIAFESKFVPLRILLPDGEDLSKIPSNADRAGALSYDKQGISIFNNSWGPSDSGGVRYSPISSVESSALANNVTTGRGGLGNIYVWAAGNGGLDNDNSNYDGYNASPYTISVGALGDDNIKAGYSEPGANLLVVAPSLGRGAGIVTTDNAGAGGYTTTDYYNSFSGTSAAAPMVSGVVALMLEANPSLNWREVQLILARTAVPVDFAGGDWVRNTAGRWVSHEYGFGRVDAASATELATQWQPVGARTGTARTGIVAQRLLPGVTRTSGITIEQNFSIEHVLITLSLNADDWSTLLVELESPSGSRSTLAEPYQTPNTNWPGSWTYLSMRHLDEASSGEWKLHVTNTRTGASTTTPTWGSWRLEVLGSGFPVQPNAAPQAPDLVIDSSAFPIEIDALAGVVDADGDPFHILSVQRPGFGQIDDLGNGRFRFTMGVTKDGTDRFGVLLSDHKGAVHWRMIQVRDPRPVGRPDSFVLRTNATELLDVLANDLDPDGNPLVITEVSPPANGTVVIVNENQLAYTPNPGFIGVDRFRYGLSDRVDGDSQAWVTVVVQESPDVAMEFDGVDDYILLPPTTGEFLRDKFTAEAWFYARDWGEYATGFGRIFDNSNFLIFLNGVDHEFYQDGSIVVYMVVQGQGAIALNSAAHAVSLHQWHHLALSFDAANTLQPVRLYVDGQLVSSTYPLENTSPPRSPIISSEVFPMYLGESATGARAFNGKLAEIRVWDRVRSASAIFADHDRRINGTEPGLQIYLPFDDIDWQFTANRGAFPFEAVIFEAQRVPRIAPWRGLEASFDLLGVSTDGWWEDSILGPVFGDRYPWIYLPEVGWAYSAGSTSDGYFLWFGEAGFGWAWVDRALFPWVYLPQSDQWLWQFKPAEGY